MGYQFERFCRALLEVGNATILVEELSMVTRANYAPESWRAMCLTGREYKTSAGVASQLRIVATAQRPAQIDKDFLDNCTLIHCGRLNPGQGAKTIALFTRQSVAAIEAMKDLEFVEFDALTQQVTTGKLAF
jgi:hypothetical protein